jgi:hypothetical protein
MKNKALFILTGLFAIFMLFGCEDSKNPFTEEVQDEVELQQIASDDDEEYLFDWGIDDGEENNMFDGYSSFAPTTGFPKVFAPINNVLRFGRKINRRFARRVVLTRIAPDTVLMSVTRELEGKFVIFEKIDYDTTDPDTLAIYRKPLRHVVRRKAIFVKRGPNDSDNLSDNGRRWKLDAISLGQGNSVPTRTIRIDQIIINNSTGDSIVFTDPLNTFLNIPDDIPTFAAGEVVTMKVLLENRTPNPVLDPNGSGATETVLLHFGCNRHHRARKSFDFTGTDPNTGYNVYEGTWQIGQQPFRIRHAVVDAIDNGTIYDNDPVAFPYNSTTWSSPYRVGVAD